MDSHHRPLGYEPSELLLLYPALVKEAALSSLGEPDSKLSMVLYCPLVAHLLSVPELLSCRPFPFEEGKGFEPLKSQFNPLP